MPSFKQDHSPDILEIEDTMPDYSSIIKDNHHEDGSIFNISSVPLDANESSTSRELELKYLAMVDEISTF